MKRAPRGALSTGLPCRLRHGFDCVREAMLASRYEVLVHDLLVRDAVDHRLLCLQLLRCGSFVAGGDRLPDVADGGAQRALEARVALARRLALPGALLGLKCVCHEKYLSLWSSEKRPGIIIVFRDSRKANRVLQGMPTPRSSYVPQRLARR